MLCAVYSPRLHVICAILEWTKQCFLFKHTRDFSFFYLCGPDARLENSGKKHESQLPSLLGDMMNLALEVKPSRNVDKPSHDQKTRRATIDPSELTKGGKSDSARSRAKSKAHDKRAQAVADANMAAQ